MRTPRRSFAAPFVVTVVGAASSAGFTSCNPPRAYTAPPDEVGKPQPDPGNTGPATPSGEARRWTVFKRGEECFAGIQVDCPKGEPGGPVPTCNPPPAMKYACPADLSLERPIQVIQYAGSETCMVEPEPIDCPAGAACNPPPPQPVACPTN